MKWFPCEPRAAWADSACRRIRSRRCSRSSRVVRERPPRRDRTKLRLVRAQRRPQRPVNVNEGIPRAGRHPHALREVWAGPPQVDGDRVWASDKAIDVQPEIAQVPYIPSEGGDRGDDVLSACDRLEHCVEGPHFAIVTVPVGRQRPRAVRTSADRPPRGLGGCDKWAEQGIEIAGPLSRSLVIRSWADEATHAA